MKKITDKKTGETFTGEVWLAEIKNGERTLKAEITDEMDVDRYDIEDVPEGKKYGGRVPKDGDDYWFLSSEGGIRKNFWAGTQIDKCGFESGFAFWTEEEAERELARRKAYFVLKEDAKGFKPNWKNYDEEKYFVAYGYEFGRFSIGWNRQTDSGNKPYFATEKDAQASIKAHPSEWKTWLGVEDGK